MFLIALHLMHVDIIFDLLMFNKEIKVEKIKKKLVTYFLVICGLQSPLSAFMTRLKKVLHKTHLMHPDFTNSQVQD